MSQHPSQSPDRLPSWGWCRVAAKADDIGRFFAAHASDSYISHSELQFGRAADIGRWSEDLAAKIAGEATRAIAADGLEGMRCALAEGRHGIAGLAFVRFAMDAPAPFAVLEDLLVDSERRGEGLGRQFMEWLDQQCRERGCARLFLESGLGNHAAHDFFARRGFLQTSIVMMRNLSVS